MRTTTSAVRPTDLVRGLGLVVEFVEPETEFTTRLTGHVGSDERGNLFSGVSVVLPNEHLVNVARKLAPGDRVTVADYYLSLPDEDAVEEDLFSTHTWHYAAEPTYRTVEVDEVRADERQIIVFDPSDSDEPLELRERFAVPFNRARFAA